jgi:hypothetical protein
MTVLIVLDMMKLAKLFKRLIQFWIDDRTNSTTKTLSRIHSYTADDS